MGVAHLHTMPQANFFKMGIALFAEFLGTMLFQLFGGAASTNAGLMNGLLLIVIVWMTAEWSGGHVNPAVTTGLMVSGNISILEGCLYQVVQVCGALVGAVLTSAMDPGTKFNNCGANDADKLDKGETFGWEFFATFILVWTVHMTAVSKPGAGNTAPFAIGLAIAATCGIDGRFTGGFANPARFFAPMVINACLRGKTHIYLLAQYGAGLIAGLICRLLLATKGPAPEDPNQSPRNTTRTGENTTAGKHTDLQEDAKGRKFASAGGPAVPSMQSGSKHLQDEEAPTDAVINDGI